MWRNPCLIYENNDRNDNNDITIGFGLTYAEFVDLCILCGCDYCGAIKGEYLYVYAFMCINTHIYICVYRHKYKLRSFFISIYIYILTS
jgi:hypothetical protein